MRHVINRNMFRLVNTTDKYLLVKGIYFIYLIKLKIKMFESELACIFKMVFLLE